eukprot:1157343-Pelagomonas_calceolata.AAC.4
MGVLVRLHHCDTGTIALSHSHARQGAFALNLISQPTYILFLELCAIHHTALHMVFDRAPCFGNSGLSWEAGCGAGAT